MKRTSVTSLLLAFALSLSGCASYSTMTFVSNMSEQAAEVARQTLPAKVVSKYATDFGAEVTSLVSRGYELVGYSKFTSPLVPKLAPWNSKIAAKRHGASYVLLAPPEAGKLRQHRYLFTYWRPSDPTKALFGAQYDDSSAQTLAALGCGGNLVSVIAVTPGTPAATMGIRAGDVIVSVDNTAVIDAAHLDSLLTERAGREVSIRYMRGDESRITATRLGSSPSTAAMRRAATPGLGVGIIKSKLNPNQAQAIGHNDALFITSIRYGATACTTELRYGDLLIAVGEKAIRQPEDIAEALATYKNQRTSLTVWRGGQKRNFPLDLTESNRALIAAAQRLAINESVLARPPWATATGQDFTWAAVTLLAAQGVMQGYANIAEDQRRRAEAYNRAEAQRLATSSQVTQGRRGRWSATTRSGRSVNIDAATASLLKSNPGYTLSTMGRRNTNLAVYDRYGKRVPLPRSPGLIAVTPFQSPDMTALMNRQISQLWNKNDLDMISYKTATQRQPFPKGYRQAKRGF